MRLDEPAGDVQRDDHRADRAERLDIHAGQRQQGRAPRRDRPERDEDVHIRVRVRQRDPRAPERPASREEYRDRAAQRFERKIVRNMTPRHVKRHQRHQRRGRGPRRHDRPPRRRIAGFLRILGRLMGDVITGLLHSRLQFSERNVAVENDEGSFRRKVHGREGDARNLLQGSLDDADACRTRHSRDRKAHLRTRRRVVFFDMLIHSAEPPV